MTPLPPDNTRKQPFNAMAIVAGLLVLVLLLIATQLVVVQERERQLEEQGRQITGLAGEVRALLEQELNATLFLASGIKAYIQARDGDLRADEIEPWLKGLFKQGEYIRNIGIAPGNRLTYIYPLEGNEAALGLYYPDLPEQWPGVKKVIDNRVPVLAGPLRLKQGGQGLIYRVPVYLDDQRYWGIISTVIDADALLALVKEAALVRAIDIALYRLDEDNRRTVIIEQHDAAQQNVAELKVTVPGSDWLLTASADKHLNPLGNTPWIRAGGWLIAIVMALLVFAIINVNTRRAAMMQALADSQRRFTRAFETAHQGMALMDTEGRWLDANDALCELLGYNRTQLLNLSLFELLSDAQPDAHKQLAPLLATDNHGATIDTCLVSQSGEEIDCLISIASIDSNPACFIVQVQDIRELRRLERMKSGFVSSVNHELRTPLTSISGSLKLITSGTLGEIPQDMRKMLDIAYNNSQRLGELINDLLDMDKLVAGKMNFHLSQQPLRPLVEQAIQSTQPYAQQYNVTLQLKGDEDALVNVDKRRLQQVITNYLSNAAKYSPANETVEVTIQPRDGHVRVAVTDRGPGIPTEFHSRMFEKFSQADSSDSRQQGGTGLGLAICKQLITAMQGELGFDTAPGAGTTFWFELPVVKP